MNDLVNPEIFELNLDMITSPQRCSDSVQRFNHSKNCKGYLDKGKC